jgi:hypothetical protein
MAASRESIYRPSDTTVMSSGVGGSAKRVPSNRSSAVQVNSAPTCSWCRSSKSTNDKRQRHRGGGDSPLALTVRCAEQAGGLNGQTIDYAVAISLWTTPSSRSTSTTRSAPTSKSAPESNRRRSPTRHPQLGKGPWRLQAPPGPLTGAARSQPASRLRPDERNVSRTPKTSAPESPATVTTTSTHGGCNPHAIATECAPRTV